MSNYIGMSEFVDYTKQGYNVRSLKYVNGVIIAFIYTGTQFIVAWNYDVTDGTWGQGHYYFDYNSAMKKYISYK